MYVLLNTIHLKENSVRSNIPWTDFHDSSCCSIQLVYPITSSDITIFGNGAGYVGHTLWATLQQEYNYGPWYGHSRHTFTNLIQDCINNLSSSVRSHNPPVTSSSSHDPSPKANSSSSIPLPVVTCTRVVVMCYNIKSYSSNSMKYVNNLPHYTTVIPQRPFI